MTPRKQLLFHKLGSMGSTLKRYEHNLMSCRKDAFGVKNLRQKGLMEFLNISIICCSLHDEYM
ncbi:hypothetical protein D910_00685 [Dendroctonus ponderosae]|uniref:Uncharacterized protein n=2 Tax=Dendroctonus ponderosae TaxID=77166 RepID=U4UZV7_DENPD|nr:hypothetical protein D910_00685 [Dendroctonus ponderosae]